MKFETVYLSSITHAIKVKKQLLKQGIDVKLVKYSNIDRGDGCGYGLSYETKDYFNVVSVLKNSNFPYSFNKL